ncbi:hypothetical protein KJ567_02190 [Candidatus Bipolaricaulota bacterium]|nr:hypothetical protein [Candidatus Bipolaricaulota bacterium]
MRGPVDGPLAILRAMRAIDAMRLAVVVFWAVTSFVVQGAETTPTWIRVFDDSGHSAFLDMIQADDGTVLVVGATNHRHMPPYSGDALIMALDVDGGVVWERTWGGDRYEQAWGVLLDDGGFYVFGETDSYGAGDRDFFLLRMTPDGDAAWFRTYGTAAREWPYGALRLANGDLFLFGMTRSSVDGDSGYAVRVSAAGDIIWEYAPPASDDELILDALETEDGRIVLCLSVDEDGGLRALDAGGSELWSERYLLDGWQFASTMLAAESGYLLAGFSMQESGSRHQADVWLAQADPSGELLRDVTFGEAEVDDYAQTLTQLVDGTYLIGGLGRGMPLFHIDAEGKVMWEYRLEDTSVHAAEAIIELDDGGLLICGMKQVAPGRLYQGVLLRLDDRYSIGL